MLREGNFTRYNSTDNTNNQSTKQEQNSKNTNENNRYSARTTIEENYSTVNRGELDNSSFLLLTIAFIFIIYMLKYLKEKRRYIYE